MCPRYKLRTFHDSASVTETSTQKKKDAETVRKGRAYMSPEGIGSTLLSFTNRITICYAQVGHGRGRCKTGDKPEVNLSLFTNI